MTKTHWIILFWVFIICMLVWQAINYNSKLNTEDQAAAAKRPEHFFFYDTSAGANSQNAAPQVNAANVQQVGYRVESNVPSRGTFTSHITVKNVGNMKAVGIRIGVYPYRGGAMTDSDGGGEQDSPVSRLPSDPLSQIGQSVDFPDLAPGESAERTIIFVDTAGASKGSNDHPEITFVTEQPKKP